MKIGEYSQILELFGQQRILKKLLHIFLEVVGRGGRLDVKPVDESVLQDISKWLPVSSLVLPKLSLLRHN